MDILLTFDYELYFGSPTGSVQRCMIKPTEQLEKIAQRHGIPLVFFVDIGFLIKMERELEKHPSLTGDYRLICDQLFRLSKSGHELQLHIHPHWEDSNYDGWQWNCDVSRYKLADFPKEEIQRIVSSYCKRLQEFTHTGYVRAFRAGGWCVQPFEVMSEALSAAGIKIDSSVFPGGHFNSREYSYDFRKAPQQSNWQFAVDPLQEEENGQFTEIPISSRIESPYFYWKLFLLGRIKPGYYRPIGDGNPMPAPGYRKKLLTQFTTQPVSVDGYNASRLNASLLQHENKKAKQLVVIGHPKALSPFSLDAIDMFIKEHKQRHRFCGYNAIQI
jgi:hypothetical protein